MYSKCRMRNFFRSQSLKCWYIKRNNHQSFISHVFYPWVSAIYFTWTMSCVHSLYLFTCCVGYVIISQFDRSNIFALVTDICMHGYSLHWRHNDHDSVSNHQPHGCLLNRLFRRRSKNTSKLRVIGLCVGNSPGPVNSPHKGPVTRKMFHLMTSSW